MRRRLYFLLPSIELTRRVVDELLLARIDEGHIHVLARAGTPMGDLPEANLLQRSDFVPAVEHGVAIGGVTGVVAGVAALSLSGMVLGGGAVLAVALAGAGVGAWAAGMIGLDVKNSRLKEFEQAVEAGEVLVMVDVPKGRVEAISEMVRSHHPEADMHGTEPTIPAFP